MTPTTAPTARRLITDDLSNDDGKMSYQETNCYGQETNYAGSCCEETN